MTTMTFRSPDTSERDREAAAEASRAAAEAAELAAAQHAFRSALRAPRRRTIGTALAVLVSFVLVALVGTLYIFSLFASGPAMSGTPGCTVVPEHLPDGGVRWVDTCPKPASTR